MIKILCGEIKFPTFGESYRQNVRMLKCNIGSRVLFRMEANETLKEFNELLNEFQKELDEAIEKDEIDLQGRPARIRYLTNTLARMKGRFKKIKNLSGEESREDKKMEDKEHAV